MSRLTTLRRVARPLVFRARLAARMLGRVLRPPVAWDGRHHPVLEHFPPWTGSGDGQFCHDFLGIRTDARFRPMFKPDPPGPLAPTYPPPHAGYFELTFVLEAVLAGAESDTFTMMELGAGYGPWMVTTHAAMRQASPKTRVQLIGAEMVDHHVAWLREHFQANGIDPAEHTVIHAGLSDRAGEGHFVPETDMGWDFGQQLRDSPAATEAGTSPKIPRAVGVRMATLAELLEPVDRVQLLHIDIQGQEERVLRHSIDEVDRKVDRLIVATHSGRIHRNLRTLLRERGWHNVHDFGFRQRVRTEFGDVQFLDGLLAWTKTP